MTSPNSTLESFQPQIRKMAESMSDSIPTPFTVDDLFQEGMIGAWKAIERFDPSKGLLKQWVPRMVKLSMIDCLRRLSSRSKYKPEYEYIEDSEWIELKTTTPSTAEEKEDSTEKALKCLLPKHREAVRLHVLEYLNYKQVGEKMGLSESRVCQIINYSKKVLQNHFMLCAK